MEPEQFAQFSDLLYPVPLSLVLILLRLLVTRSLLRPLAARLGLRTRGRSARLASAPSPGVARLLEAAHSSRHRHAGGRCSSGSRHPAGSSQQQAACAGNLAQVLALHSANACGEFSSPTGKDKRNEE